MTDYDYMLRTPSRFMPPEAKPEPISVEEKVLVIGAGGLGCEILKDLALSGFKNIDVIDMDTIDLSNLNRQFLFRPKDIGQPKSVVAANFVMERVKGINVVAYNQDLTSLSDDFFYQYKLVIAGLDSIKARRWINSMLLKIVSFDDEGNPEIDTIIPLIDGGTEALGGQTRVIIPHITSCFECSMHTHSADPLNFQLCTLANKPRLPEHCIAYILHQWESNKYEQWHGVKLDKDNPEHMTFIYEEAKKRAAEFSINGVTFKLTQGVVKRIIPAIASTNAIISAACVNEALKILTFGGPYLQNWMSYNGGQGVYTHSFNFEKNPDCLVCANNTVLWDVDPTATLEEFMDSLKQSHKFQLQAPSITATSSSGKKTSLYLRGIVGKKTHENAAKAMKELVQEGDELSVTDPGLAGTNLSLIVRFVAGSTPLKASQ